MLKIGNYILPSRVLLAPLSGCSDLSFRIIMRSYGAKFAFLEMADANGLTRSKKSLEAMATTAKDRPIAGQLLGVDPDTMLAAAKKMLKLVPVKFIDINAACPVKKVVRRKAGSHMLKEPHLLYKIIKKLSSSLEVPITVKLRAGFDSIDRAHLVDVAKKCEENGASAIFIHGRSRSQGYSGPVDIGAIAAVKSAVGIPVFGSGNIFTPEQAKKMMDETACDGVLIARGAFGNPWIFKNIEKYLKGSPIFSPTLDDRKKAALKHLKLVQKYVGRVGPMRKVALWYMKAFPNAAELRGRINFAKDRKELEGIIRSAGEV